MAPKDHRSEDVPKLRHKSFQTDASFARSAPKRRLTTEPLEGSDFNDRMQLMADAFSDVYVEGEHVRQEVRPPKAVEPEIDRDAEMVKMRADGIGLGAIGKRFGVSRERVRQVILEAGGPTAAEARAARLLKAKAVDDEATESIRVLLESRGAMLATDVAEERGISIEEVGRLWPKELAAYRIVPGIQGAATWSDDETYEAIRIAGTFEFPLRMAMYDDLIRLGEVKGPSAVRITQRFGSWTGACEAAGVEPAAAFRSNYQSAWSDDDLIAIVREYLLLPESRGTYDGFTTWRQETGAPSAMTVRNRLGSWSAVKSLALSGSIEHD